ncbi:TonB-linked outer membrane protein, SusC/RagA family [Maribacter ulvicola]|uniref:TonB-linked outer membrane protein, SusC/RagA family n=2 Tax=Maribacter ulvicola TaxID=228959 RepID=A0A1N6X6G2_9FLAO|nr:TonB-linked outer membrane protein, SusC/RagA family [Maribacter ulvicola]
MLMCFVLSSMLWSQDKKISGTVTDQEGVPLPGVNITIEGTNQGTQTDFDGEFSINVTEGDMLKLSYLGFKTQTQTVTQQNYINVMLMEDSSQLDEVVVVGYGTTGKKDITGSIVTIDSKAITERSVTNISNALQGAAAGVSVTRSSSEPGAGNTIRIRGNTTLQGDNSPLILVDDIPVGSLNDVPPDQVESISILKDGAASAIYGSRAAAGVIIITTKRAKTGVTRVTYNAEYFINKPTKEREYVDALGYMQLDNEKVWNDAGNNENLYPQWSEETINEYTSGTAELNRDLYPDTDWAGLILKKQTTGTRHNINVSSGSEKLKTNLSLGYENQDAFYANRDWTRFTTRINNDIKVTDKIGVIADINFRLVEDRRPILDPTGDALQAAPIYAALWEDGRIAEGKSGNNVYARLNEGGSYSGDSYQFGGKLGIFFKPIEALKISLNLAPRFDFFKSKSFSKTVRYWAFDDPEMLGSSAFIQDHGSTNLNEKRTNNNSITTQAIVNYNKKFNKHSVELLGGYEEYSNESEGLEVLGREFLSNDFPYLSQAPTDKVFDDGSYISETAYASVFGRFNYNFDNKYYLGATVRRDGSSRFSSDYRWGNFPSISAAWTISNENFMESFEPISFLKLKASNGSLGNDRLGNYLYLSVLQISDVLIANGANAELVRGLAQRYLTTPDISWETTNSTNFGVELGLFDDRLSLEGEYFIKKTEDMLLSLSVPDLVGFDDPTVNVGSMETKGWEVQASWNDRIGDDFNFSISANVSDSESIIGDINDKRLFSGNTLSEEGSQFRELYGLQSDGLFQTQDEVDNSPLTSDAVKPGDVKYKDLSGPDGTPDGVINDFDKTFLGSSGPRYYYGGRINLDYKGFDFGLVFQGVGKYNFNLGADYIQPLVGGWLTPSKEYASSYWSVNKTPEENLSVKYPRISSTSNSNNYRFSDYWLMDGSYLKIKTLSLGYTIPSKALEKTGVFNSIRLFASANDFFTFDKLPDGVDPEQASGRGYFLTKSFVFGIKANF